MNRRAELERRLADCRDPRERELIEGLLAEADDGLPPDRSPEWDAWAIEGENRYETAMGWGRDDI